MSAEIAFDTHRFVKNLTDSGFTEAQAEALAHEQIHLLKANLATRSDLAAVKSDLEMKIEQVKSDLEMKIEQVKSDLQLELQQVKSDLFRWMFSAMLAQAGLIVALIRFF